MKKILVFALMLAGCAHNNGGNPIAPLTNLSLDHNPVTIAVGDAWLYKKTFIQTPIFGKADIPDTVFGYSFFHATKDTTIKSKEYVIIEGKDYDVGRDTVLVHAKQCAIHCGDSIEMYEFGSGDYTWLSGVMKRQAVPITKFYS